MDFENEQEGVSMHSEAEQEAEQLRREAEADRAANIWAALEAEQEAELQRRERAVSLIKNAKRVDLYDDSDSRYLVINEDDDDVERWELGIGTELTTSFLEDARGLLLGEWRPSAMDGQYLISEDQWLAINPHPIATLMPDAVLTHWTGDRSSPFYPPSSMGSRYLRLPDDHIS